MSDPPKAREVIDVDDLDIFCTGIRHCIRIDRSPSPRPRKRARSPHFAALPDDPSPTHTAHSPSASRSPVMDHRTELQRITQSELVLRTALLDPRPPKRRATDAIMRAVSVVKNHSELKRKERERVPEVIEISSDSEPENLPPKRQKVEEGTPPRGADDNVPKLEAEFARAGIRSPAPSDRAHSDEDDDCINFLASLDISNERNWAPQPESNRAEDLTPIHDLDLGLSKPPTLSPFRLPRKRPLVDYSRVPLDWISVVPRGTMSTIHGTTRFPTPFYHARRQDRLLPRRSPSLFHERGYTKLELTAKYPHLTSGSINKIIQNQGTVVLCAVVEAGLEDSDSDDDDLPPLPPENKAGSLVVYRHGRVHVPPAHCHLRETSTSTSHDLMLKYYNISDVAFNPLNPAQFLSAGHDLVIETWEVADPDDNNESESLKLTNDFTLDSRPQDLVYAPDGSALAISCYDGTVRLCSQDIFEDMMGTELPFKRFYVAPKGSGHAAGSTLWGRGPSERLLFTSSESRAKGDHSGFHHAFDAYRGGQVVKFDAMESGDATALNPDGSTLVLFTCGRNSSHPVRLYDVRRKVPEAYETEELEKFQLRPSIGSRQESGDSEEVNHASFSPDGRLLAVARNDNALHIYDLRAMSRGPLCRFEHHESDAVGGGGFGIVSANWIQGRDRIGIMSGGNDGCVRLWEPALGSSDNIQGMVIGRTDFDVAHFSLGDRENGEFPLVIGDSGGGMHTYDYTNEDGTRI